MAVLAVAMVQLRPEHGQVRANIARADALLAGVDGAGLDALLLPECAFTGYLFAGEAEARAVAEVAGQGETFRWAQRTARRLRCGVFVGFVRRDGATDKLYNSQMVVDPDGGLVCTYDKHFLYAADEVWAQPGACFRTVKCDWLGDLKVGLGICMDINPEAFQSPWGKFEFARFHLEEKSDVIFFSSAWCNRHPDEPAEGPVDGPGTINYWAQRLQPLIGQDVFFFAANRIGSEPACLVKPGATGNVTFVGSSCAISLREPALVDCLDTDAETVLLATVKLAPAQAQALARRAASASAAPQPDDAGEPCPNAPAPPAAPPT